MKMRDLAKFRLETGKKQEKKVYDKRAKERDNSVNDWVCIQKIQLDLQGDTKLKNLYLGPYQVLDFVTPVNISLRDYKTGKKLPRTVHVNKVKNTYLHRT